MCMSKCALGQLCKHCYICRFADTAFSRICLNLTSGGPTLMICLSIRVCVCICIYVCVLNIKTDKSAGTSQRWYQYSLSWDPTTHTHSHYYYCSQDKWHWNSHSKLIVLTIKLKRVRIADSLPSIKKHTCTYRLNSTVKADHFYKSDMCEVQVRDRKLLL